MSFVTWFSFFDVGLSNGLRNKLSESLSIKNIRKSREYISTSYFFIFILFSILIFIFILSNHFIDWFLIFKVSNLIDYNSLSLVLNVIIISFLLRFIFQIISFILLATHKTAIKHSILPLSNFLILLLLIFEINLFQNSLINVSIYYGIIPLIVFFVYTSIFFLFNRNLSPSLSYISINSFKKLFKVGSIFFVINICNVIIMSIGNIFILNIVGPEEVSTYDITLKYFSAILIVYGVLVSPLWSLFTDAFYKNDNKWIKSTIRKINYISFVFILIIIIMNLFSSEIIKFWINKSIVLNDNIINLTSLFIIFSILNNHYIYFLNGSGKIKIQFIFTIISTLFLIIFSYILINYFNSSIGYLIPLVFIRFIGALIWRYQYHIIITNPNSNSIWNK